MEGLYGLGVREVWVRATGANVGCRVEKGVELLGTLLGWKKIDQHGDKLQYLQTLEINGKTM